ncbi:MAG: NADH-quinone oxidoreductase subunit J [Chloroflexota bacterium]|jgi:NADH-quinone oxidoreductase subunit J|nr:NADH-quinone oxidoreductase subunit J [Lentimicrobium sp.]
MDSNILFILFACVILTFAVLTVTTRRVLRAAVYLLFVLVSTAGLYFMLNFNFLAAVQLTVYAGGIVVLMIFSILLTSHISEKARRATLREGIFSALSAVAGAMLTIVLIMNHTFTASSEPAISTDVQNIGRQLVSYGDNGYALPFEVISILLLAAMVGSIIVARKESLASNIKSPDTNQE